MKIIDYDGKEVNWYMQDLAHYNEDWLRWIITDLHEKFASQEVSEQ